MVGCGLHHIGSFVENIFLGFRIRGSSFVVAIHRAVNLLPFRLSHTPSCSINFEPQHYISDRQIENSAMTIIVVKHNVHISFKATCTLSWNWLSDSYICHTTLICPIYTVTLLFLSLLHTYYWLIYISLTLPMSSRISYFLSDFDMGVAPQF